MPYLVDTNACINFLRGRNAHLISRWRETPPHQILVCSVVLYELRFGAERCLNSLQEHRKLDNFAAPYLSLPFDDACAETCAKIRRELEIKGMVIGPHDLQIASVALTHELILVTHNVAEFSRIKELKIEDWEEPPA